MTREDLNFRQAVAQSAYRRGIINAQRYQQIMAEIREEKEHQDRLAHEIHMEMKAGVERILQRCGKLSAKAAPTE